MLSAGEAAQLDRFALSASRAAVSAAGRRPVNARGFSLEFHDFRRYQPGDDPRAIDWAIDARLSQLVVRLYRAEGHVPLHLLLDTSASMGIGTPSKLAAASRVAAALAYVAARRRDPLALASFDAAVHVKVEPGGGRPQLLRVLEALASVRASGPSGFDRPLSDYGSTSRGPGLVVVLSDMIGAAFDGIRFLLHRGFSVALVHVLASEELTPVIDSAVELLDVEGMLGPLVVDGSELQAYGDRLAAFMRETRDFCAANGVAYVPLDTGSGFEPMIGACLHGGLLALHA